MTIYKGTQILPTSIGNNDDDPQIEVDFTWLESSDKYVITDVWVLHAGGKCHANYFIEYCSEKMINMLREKRDKNMLGLTKSELRNQLIKDF